MWMVTDNNELCHYGTPRHSGRFPFGSGKRPFQGVSSIKRKKYINEDGSLTEDGKAQKKKYVETNAYNKAKQMYFSNKRNEAENISQAGKKAVEATRSARKILKRFSDKKEKENDNIDLSKMSDQELIQSINRINLEKNYLRLIKEEKGIDRGREIINDILDTVGDALTIGGSAAAIYWTIKQAMG